MILENRSEHQVFAELIKEYTLFYLRPKKLTLAINRITNTLDWIIVGKMSGDAPVMIALGMHATYDRSRFDAQSKMLYVDALAMTSLMIWAYNTRQRWKSAFRFQCYFENLFADNNGMALPDQYKAALAAACNLDVPGDLHYRKCRAIEQHPLEFARLQNGYGRKIGIIEFV